MVAITKIRLSDQVFLEVKKMITENGYAPGDKFHSENELTKMLGVSRSSVREAIRLLEVSGFVRVHQGKGIFIADPSGIGQAAFAEWVRKNETTLSELFEIRMIIDTKAAAYAAKKADEADILKLEEICVLFANRADTENTAEMIKIDEEFHLQLARSTKNRTLYMIMKTMTQSLSDGWVTSLTVPGRIRKSVAEHRDIVMAIRNHDPVLAEKMMETHLANALDEIRSSMGKK
jgi:GntR family transcriptional regulator, transcriptional repressor for pyruvate dehydrogenase complex